MKASELMMGDWFQTTYPTGKVEFRKVEGVMQNHIVCNNGVTNAIDPIPLTAEILEKNGFGDSFATNEKFFECGDFEIWIDFKEQGYWANIKNRVGELYFEGNKRYVHELQHALRLCGIDKEIVL